jgi:hypothetical protein
MKRVLLSLVLPIALAISSPAAAEDPKCGPHEHLVVERDPDEGAMTRRCLCDEGWDADGPAPPCRERPKAPGKGPAPARDKKDKGKK